MQRGIIINPLTTCINLAGLKEPATPLYLYCSDKLQGFIVFYIPDSGYGLLVSNVNIV